MQLYKHLKTALTPLVICKREQPSDTMSWLKRHFDLSSFGPLISINVHEHVHKVVVLINRFNQLKAKIGAPRPGC